MSDKYLASQVNYLTAEQAERYKRKGFVVARDSRDGTWTATRLVDQPVQPGQAPWSGRK
jgi:hypothetical protein